MAGDWVAAARDAVAVPSRPPRVGLDADQVARLLGDAHQPDDRAARIAALEARFTAELNDYLLTGLSYAPDLAVGIVPHVRGVKADRPWTTTVEVYQVLYHTCGTGRAREYRVTAPLLARTWFRLASLPARHPGLVDRDDLLELGEWEIRAREAREAWLSELDRWDEHVRAATYLDTEDELVDVLAVQIPGRADHAGRDSRSGWAVSLDAADRAAFGHVIETHLLPRFAVGQVCRFTWRQLDGVVQFLSGLALLCVTLAAACAVLGSAGRPDALTLGSVFAVVGYGAVAAAGALGDRSATWPWLLRQPAGAAVGLLSLAALTPSWWQRSAGEALGGTGWAAVGLLVAGAGYLLVEAANHGLRGTRLARRVGAVTGIGVLHAALVSLVALRWLVPVVADDGPDLVGWWDGGRRGVLPVWLLLLFATGWSFATGVFAQIIWDDRPVTAPLSHVSWRGRG